MFCVSGESFRGSSERFLGRFHGLTFPKPIVRETEATSLFIGVSAGTYFQKLVLGGVWSP